MLLSVAFLSFYTMSFTQIDTTTIPPKVYYHIDWSELGAESGQSAASSQFTCEPVTFDGHTYAVVQIGTQCWFAENLQTLHFANGDSIPTQLSLSDWQTTDEAAMAVYDDIASNLSVKGGLYNWYAAVDERQVCPEGWKVPSNQEWYVLGEEIGAFGGTKLKSTNWDGSDAFGFQVERAGIRTSGGTYNDSNKAFYWTRTPMNNGNAMNTFFQANIEFIERDNYGNPVRSGFSIRCMKD